MSEYFLTTSKSYADEFALAKEIYLYPGRFYKEFESGRLLDWVKEIDSRKYRGLLELRKQNFIPDVFLFEASYILNPYMELRYHGFLFHDYTEIGKIIKRFTPKIDVYLLDLIRFGLLEKYMKKQGDDYKKPELFARVQALRGLYEKNHNRAYFHMAYDLDPDRRFYYDGRVYEDPKEFLKTRLSIRNLFEFAGSFEIDNAFLAWIEIMGQSALLERYESLISLVDEKARECAENGQVSGENQNSDLLALFYKGLNEK